MLTRIPAAFIIVFWLTMTGLLMHREFWPEQAPLREVPVEHVLKLLFLHEQASELAIFSERTRIGHVRLHPKTNAETGERSLLFSGSLSLRLAGDVRRRASWQGELLLEPGLAVREAFLSIEVPPPEDLRTELHYASAKSLIRYALSNGGRILERDEFTLDDAGLNKALGRFAVDPAVLAVFRGSAAPSLGETRVTAQQSFVRLQGERLESYLLSVQQNGQTLFECQVSQLGQILSARTILGWQLGPSESMP
ncbi:MAG: hypothetical protein M3463_16185 [Verrucomicrobiota bacterium]|nr:hypothetical protein [Verrucomicrobiota bacterium]